MYYEYEQAFKTRKPIPKKEALKLKPGTFVQLKWLDGPDTVVMLVERLENKKGDISLDYLEQGRGRDTHAIHTQIVAVLGQAEWPALVLGVKT